ncbi:hypothetical protein LIER_36031 [Lithospermum erythrorhizon]|uniref:Uncharacterized protein n=1 Tax=Lithospermum erythrorhizon TaxID=34254 RepID=A0AAV3P0K9_LITER
MTHLQQPPQVAYLQQQPQVANYHNHLLKAEEAACIVDPLSCYGSRRGATTTTGRGAASGSPSSPTNSATTTRRGATSVSPSLATN